MKQLDIIFTALLSGKSIRVVKRYLQMKYKMEVSDEVLINREKQMKGERSCAVRLRPYPVPIPGIPLPG